MSVRRRFNWLSQARVDVPHIRSVESATSNDFDELLRGLLTGEDEDYIIRGFEISMTGAVGGAANGLQMLVAEGCLLHGGSNESGTFFIVPSGTDPETLNSTVNDRVQGSFTPNAINYVGIEYERVVDDDSSDQVYLWDPTNKNETSKTVPLSRLLKYKIVITTSIWASNVLPICKISTDVANNVTNVEDERNGFLRLGKAGRSGSNPSYVYPWTNHSEGRDENPSSSNSNAVNPFRGGDKMLFNMKEWMDAIMSSFKEIKGTTFWYSENVGGSIAGLRADLANTVFTGRGNISHSAATPGKINWSDDIYLKFVSGRLSYKFLANPSSSFVELADNEVAYVKLIRDIDISPNLIWVNGSAIVASVGAVSWTSSLVAGDWIKVATEDSTKYYEIASVDSLSQVTLTVVYGGLSTGASGSKSQYAYGVYEAVAVPSTDRHIKIAERQDVPFDQNHFWFLLRADNSGAIPRVYARFIAAEIQQGETRDISDNTTDEVLTYIGSTSESSSSPIYSEKFGPFESEVTQITCPVAASITSGQYFTISAAANMTNYYVWFNKDGSGGDPMVVGRVPIEVAISTGDTSSQVAASLSSALSSVVDFSASDVLNVVTCTNTVAGTATDAVNVNVSGLSLSVITQGSGEINYFITDGDDLTLAIKKLDSALNAATAIGEGDYEELLTVVSGAPADDNEVTGPITAPDTLTLPADSRALDAVRGYTVGEGELEVYLNGQRLVLGEDWNEIGAPGTESNTITIEEDLVVGDEVIFRMSSEGLGSSGGEGSSSTPTHHYRENLAVVSGAPADDNEVTGPVLSGNNVTIPLDSKNADAVKKYIVGLDELEVDLNGQQLDPGIDYDEVGTSGSESLEIELLMDLVVGDVLTFRIDPISVAATGGGEANTGFNLGTGAAVFKNKAGTILNFRRIKAGAGATVTENADDITVSAAPSTALDNVVTVVGTNYGATSANDTILVENSGANRTVTLPTAVGNSGKILKIKKKDAGNTLFIASVLNQTLDDTDITATPYSITVQYESITIISDGSDWWII